MVRLKFLAVAALVLFASCNEAVLLIHHTAAIDPGARPVFLVVAQGLGEGGFQFAIENALMSRGVSVRATDWDGFYNNAAIANKAGTEKQSVMSAIMTGMSQGGKIAGEKELFDQIKTWNNIKDEIVRTGDLQALLKKSKETQDQFCAVSGITHILVVTKMNNFQYTARLIAVPQNSVEFVLYVQTDETGFSTMFPVTQVPTSTDISEMAAEYTQSYNLRFAQYLVTKMLGGK